MLKLLETEDIHNPGPRGKETGPVHGTLVNECLRGQVLFAVTAGRVPPGL
jgi:hypothetical protein